MLNVVAPDPHPLTCTWAPTRHELCARVKNDPRYEFTPVVILTAVSDLESRVAGLAAGADDFFSKPVGFAELRARVATLLRVKFLVDQLERTEAVTTSLALTIGRGFHPRLGHRAVPRSRTGARRGRAYHSGAAAGRLPPRSRQDHGARQHPAQAGIARRAGAHADAGPSDCGLQPDPGTARPGSGATDHPPSPRAVDGSGIRWPQRRGDPARRPHHLMRRRVRCPALPAPLQTRPAAERGGLGAATGDRFGLLGRHDRRLFLRLGDLSRLERPSSDAVPTRGRTP